MNVTSSVADVVSLQCAQCGDRYRVCGDQVLRVRHWCWPDEATGRWCSMGWAVTDA
ncbi:hypothetical protein [Streptomyces sp. NPDC001781]